MQTFVQPRLVKVAPTGVKANIMQATSTKEPAAEKTAGKRFLAVLLSALAASAA